MRPYFAPSRDTSPFELHLDTERIRSMREIAVLASVLYVAFGVLDLWAIPSAVSTVWLIRGAVVAVLMAILWLTRFPIFLRLYIPITFIFYLTMGIGIEAMIYIADRNDLARNSYYTGLLLVTMALYTWSFMTVWQTAATGVVLVGMYVLIALRIHSMGSEQEWPVLMMNCFFFISANIIGVFASLQRNRYLKDSFLLSERLASDLERTEELHKQTEFWSEHDALTGLPNRKHLMRHLDGAMKKASTDGSSLALLFVDLDGFKPINDAKGHATGDLVLKIVGQRLMGCVRERDLYARIGGDEFVVVLSVEQQRTDIAIRVAESIIASIEKPIRDPDIGIPLSASIGIAFFPEHAQDAQSLLHAADMQMYRAKQRGKATVSVASDACTTL